MLKITHYRKSTREPLAHIKVSFYIDRDQLLTATASLINGGEDEERITRASVEKELRSILATWGGDRFYDWEWITNDNEEQEELREKSTEVIDRLFPEFAPKEG